MRMLSWAGASWMDVKTLPAGCWEAGLLDGKAALRPRSLPPFLFLNFYSRKLDRIHQHILKYKILS